MLVYRKENNQKQIFQKVPKLNDPKFSSATRLSKNQHMNTPTHSCPQKNPPKICLQIRSDRIKCLFFWGLYIYLPTFTKKNIY